MSVDIDKLDKIHIRDLHLRCIIGTYEHERHDRQDVVINITLYADLTAARRTDRIEDTVDYKACKKRIRATVEESACQLVEHLAERVAEACLVDTRVHRAVVTLDKPGALRVARSVAVEITKDR